ncbi:MAG: ribonuclease P protein component [Alphaproteobacteria bacterium]|jgi:ribonuclease P protein component|nr:ribonuclease P protein component [Alphaproteobacteria bacterium]
MAAALGRLKRRSEFLRVAAAGRKWATPGLVLQARQRASTEGGMKAEQAARVGFTASKRVGNAVARNRAKRRLRAVAAEVLPLYAAPGHDYVVIGRQATLDRDWDDLKGDLEQALRRIGASVAKGDRART